MELTPNQLEQIRKQYRLSPREIIGISTGTAKQYAHVLFAKVKAESKLSLAMKIVDLIHE